MQLHMIKSKNFMATVGLNCGDCFNVAVKTVYTGKDTKMEDGNWKLNKKDVEATLTKGLILFIGCS